MRRRHPLFHAPILAAAMLPALTLTHCGKKEEGAPGTKAATAAEAEKAVAKPATPFGDDVSKLGAAAMLPINTELYIGSAGLKKHSEAVKASNWWKEVSALIDDKTPAAETTDESLETLKQLWGDDFFLAGGAGFADSIRVLRDFNRFYNEMNFRVLMTGSAAGLSKTDFAPTGAMAYLQTILADPAMLDHASALVKKIEMFPLVFGVKTADAEQKLAKLITPEVLKEMEEKKIKVSDHKTSDGHAFKAATIDVGLLIDENAEKQVLENLPPDLPEASRKQIEDVVKNLRTKKMQIAWGAVNGQIIFASGKNLDHLKFAASPAESLLANPALASVATFAAKNLFALSYVNKESLLALHDDQPFLPMLRGVVSAMKDNAMFGEAGKVLSVQLDELQPLEVAAFGRQATDAVGALWWEKGVQGAGFGGLDPRFFDSGKPLNYASLLNGEKVLFGLTYHGNPQFAKDVRTWAEKIFKVVYIGAKEMVKAGIAGPEGQQQVAFFDMLVLPTLQKVYQADKDIAEKGLGNEVAFVVDIAGKAPELPNMPTETFPRITTVSEVKNRAEVAAGWTTINDTINGIAAMIGANAGGGGGAGGPGSNIIPPVQGSEKDGFTTWTYQFPLFDGDLNPNATINDKHLILSTSKPAAEAIAATLAKPAPGVDGALWKADVEVLGALVKDVSAVAPNRTDEQAANIEQFFKFIKPFKTMQGRIYEEGGVWKQTFQWDISDPVSFD